MKTLILIIFLSCLYGQDTTNVSNILDATYKGKLTGVILDQSKNQPIMRVDTTDYNLIYFKELLKHWDDYKIICYNDSTETVKHMTGKDDYGLDTPCLVTHYTGKKADGFSCINRFHWYQIGWIYREPTFNGFMEYIKTTIGER